MELNMSKIPSTNFLDCTLSWLFSKDVSSKRFKNNNILDLLNVYVCIYFGRCLEGIPALYKTELQTRVTHDLVL